ncbi:hypothetical protein ACFYPX_26825 [Micromonospora zamorensis]|uniref:hypothetical protein n=1 Tax=Micromonospora zamorensis TaxID=709883 RepID=UPI0036C2B0F4
MYRQLALREHSGQTLRQCGHIRRGLDVGQLGAGIGERAVRRIHHQGADVLTRPPHQLRGHLNRSQAAFRRDDADPSIRNIGAVLDVGLGHGSFRPQFLQLTAVGPDPRRVGVFGVIWHSAASP